MAEHTGLFPCAPGARLVGLRLGLNLHLLSGSAASAHKLPHSQGTMGWSGERTTAMDGSSSPMLILLGGCWQWKLSSGIKKLSVNSTAGCVVWGSR